VLCSFIFVSFVFVGMVQIAGEFPAPRLLAGHMGPSSLAAYLLSCWAVLIFGVLAASGFMQCSKRGKCYWCTKAGYMLQI